MPVSHIIHDQLPGDALLEKVFIKISQNSQESNCGGVSFSIKIPAQVFPCKFCEVFKSTYFVEHLQTVASDHYQIRRHLSRLLTLKRLLIRFTLIIVAPLLCHSAVRLICDETE